ncbi:MAG: MarR family transcriptional regulator [Symploca sp. SIO3C6]|uniref:MarR family transcriptional regulator n=1 Tax=Symploca sp. SIO1C4 TaxID=2607765 RepID=A0A6B3NGL1_9CYAN|nr:MarR family transcriptional regulator [Symploca sp. SIO3C6]NER28771.1 MarR family transcriptional regulator [Symploca sp. SIO1C4]NET04192.1 MarR family transcriptional regulator [Symploca sp. SIO2B6]
MFNIFEQFKTWYLKNRDQFLTLFSKTQKEEILPERPLTELPLEIRQRLLKTTQSLPSPPAELEVVQNKVNSALEWWRSQPSVAANSLVIFSSPVEPGAILLNKSIEAWASKHQTPIQILQWQQRPADPTSIKKKIQTQLGLGSLTTSQQQEIVVIPQLSRCFLRCVEGLGGIEYLRDTILQNRSRFWLIGSSQICWDYLDYLCKVKAYFEQSLRLPALSGEQLQEWLAPVVSELNINFGKRFLKLELSEEDESSQRRYFDRLAAVSDGLSRVAVELFWQSLCYEESSEETTNPHGKVTTTNPSLPDLLDLTADEQYLLYSLLLHTELTLPHLALSLGDDQTLVQHQVQVLRQKGIINRQEQLLQVNPIHYPRLRAELDNNNFLING